MVWFILYIWCLGVSTVASARILAIYPVPSISHQAVFRPVTLELARRGHEVVVVTTNPVLPKERPPDNVTEIDLSFAYERLKELIMIDSMNMFRRGVIIGREAQTKPDIYHKMIKLFVSMIESSEMKKITEDKSQHFDLIIAEAFMNYHTILSRIYDAPMILFTSFHGFPEFYEAIGAPFRHPTLYPTVFSDIYGSISLTDKLKQVKFEFDFYNSMKQLESHENVYLKQNYGHNAPTVAELRNNIDMLFINSHPIFCNNKPLPPNAVYVGPLHLQPLKELPQDIKTFLDNSKTGVIYVSLGTNVNTTCMDEDLLGAFIEAFRALHFNILWKVDSDIMDNLPENVKAATWLPQRDLLAHPKIKLFVTQGGLQSTDEAIDAEVPLVGIPMLGDQYFNVYKYEQFGIGVKVDALTLDKESLLRGIETVLNDESYKKNIKKLKQIVNDHPQSPLERAVWWTEYVIRHRGAKHLRSPAANISWTEYYMADLVIALICVLISTLTLIWLVVRYLIATVLRNIKVKEL